MTTSSPRLCALAILVASLFALRTASAQDAPLDRAKQMIADQKGKGRGAFELLAPLEGQRAGNADFDYQRGLAAIDAGEFTRAVFALERVLAVRPDYPQARAAIARAYFLTRENKAARVGASALVHAGLGDLVATDPDDYVERALQFCQRTAAAKTWTSRTRSAFAPDQAEQRFAAYVRTLEDLYLRSFKQATRRI